MINEKFKEEILKKLDEISNIDVDTLKREGQDFNFEDVYPMIVEAFQSIKNLKAKPEYLDLIPRHRKQEIKENISEFIETIKQIQSFQPKTQANPGERARNIKMNFESSYDKLRINLLIGLDAYVYKKQFNSSVMTRKMKEIRHMQNSMIESKKKADETLNVLQDASGIKGASEFTDIFYEEAKNHKKTADRWLFTSGIMAVLVFVFMFHIINIFINTNSDSLQSSAQVFFSKLLLLSFLSYVFYQLIKNYNANMHLYTINKHRENCLRTFPAFTNSAKEKETQDAVLIQATKAIFEAGDTGYISSKEMGTSSENVFKLMIDGMRGKSSG